jgi:hypothetical protein
VTERKSRLTWGSVALMSEGAPAGLPYTIEASADGSNFGNPEAVIAEVQSRLQDGSLAQVTSYGNRSAPIYLQITSDTYDGLDAGEEALVAEEQRPGYNTLAWTPDEDDAAVTVFDVVYAQLDFLFDDLGELRKDRRFLATLTCYPHPRSDTEVVATAAPTPPDEPTTVNVNNGSSTTGWSATRNGASFTPTSSGGAVKFGGSVASTSHITAVLTGSFTGYGTTPYVMVNWARLNTGPVDTLDFLGFADGVAMQLVSEGPSPTTGYTRSTFRVPTGTTSVAAFSFQFDVGSSAHVIGSMSIDSIDRTDAAPGSTGTRRQLYRTLPVAGTMRTQGRLAIEHDTDALDEALVYVYANDGSGYLPSLRQFYYAGGTVTADDTLYSGARNMLDTQVSYLIQANLLPGGSYRMYARLRGNSAGPVTLIAGSLASMGGGSVLGSSADLATLDITTDWAIYDLVGMSLPPVKLVSPASAYVLITLQDGDTSGIDIDVDEVWLFNEDIGGLTHVDCGTGTGATGGPSNRLWLDPATITNDGKDAVYVGHSADRSDAFNPGDKLKGWTAPVFEPSSVNVFTACAAEDVAVDLSHYPRWRHNARAVA